MSQAIRSWPGIIGGHGLPGTNSIKPLGHFLCFMPSNQCYISPSTVLSLAFICEDISSAFYYGPWTDDTAPSPVQVTGTKILTSDSFRQPSAVGYNEHLHFTNIKKIFFFPKKIRTSRYTP